MGGSRFVEAAITLSFALDDQGLQSGSPFPFLLETREVLHFNSGFRAVEEGLAMSVSVHAVFENGVFRPTQPVDLPESSEVEIEFREIRPVEQQEVSFDEVYAILGRRHTTGEPDLAARHDEHQP